MTRTKPLWRGASPPPARMMGDGGETAWVAVVVVEVVVSGLEGLEEVEGFAVLWDVDRASEAVEESSGLRFRVDVVD